MTHSYTYWLLRYVPDSIRGEMVNIGVLVGRDGGDWSLRRVRSYRRANRLGGDASRVDPWLTALEYEIRSIMNSELELFRDSSQEPLSSARIHRMRLRLNNSIQIGEPAAVQGETAAETAGFLFDFLVSESAIPQRSTTRRRLVGQLRDQYEQIAQLDVGSTLRSRPQARVGRQRGRFDFAVVNNEVQQLSQVWSFDLADTDRLEQEIHAWSFLVTRLRNDGGHLGGPKAHPTELLPFGISTDVAISAVVQVPSERRVSDRFDVFLAAQDAWRDLDIEVVPSTEMGRVAREAIALTA
jgi:hypothetical protein